MRRWSIITAMSPITRFGQGLISLQGRCRPTSSTAASPAKALKRLKLEDHWRCPPPNKPHSLRSRRRRHHDRSPVHDQLHPRGRLASGIRRRPRQGVDDAYALQLGASPFQISIVSAMESVGMILVAVPAGSSSPLRRTSDLFREPSGRCWSAWLALLHQLARPRRRPLADRLVHSLPHGLDEQLFPGTASGSDDPAVSQVARRSPPAWR